MGMSLMIRVLTHMFDSNTFDIDKDGRSSCNADGTRNLESCVKAPIVMSFPYFLGAPGIPDLMTLLVGRPLQYSSIFTAK